MKSSNTSSINTQNMPFYVGSGVLIAWVLIGLLLKPDVVGSTAPWISSLVMIFAVMLACTPAFQERRFQASKLLSDSMRDVSTAISDLETVKREHARNRAVLEGAVHSMERLSDQLTDNIDRYQKIALAQKRIEDQLINSRQEAGQASKRIEEWEQAAVEYLQSLERILSFPEIDGSLRKATQRSVKDFVGLTRSLGFDLILPEKNSVLNEQDCIVVGSEVSSEVDSDRVVRCTSWGFRRNSGASIKAKVVLAASEKPTVKQGTTKRSGAAAKDSQPSQVVKEASDVTNGSKAGDASSKKRLATPTNLD